MITKLTKTGQSKKKTYDIYTEDGGWRTWYEKAGTMPDQIEIEVRPRSAAPTITPVMEEAAHA